MFFLSDNFVYVYKIDMDKCIVRYLIGFYFREIYKGLLRRVRVLRCLVRCVCVFWILY